MSYSRILLNITDRVGTVTLNRPEVHNAFDEVVIAELTEAFVRLSEDASVRAVVLHGQGKSFCAGADLSWMGKMAGYSREENLADSRALQRMFAAIYECPKVTIAAVHGAAIGGGAGLVAVCDLAIATPDARFALSEVRLGLVPAVIGPYVLEKVGMGAARALFVTGERIDAEEALRIGLIHEIAAAEDLDAAIGRRIALIEEAGPQAIAMVKYLLREIAGKTPADAAETTIQCIADLRVSAEGQEGIRAFLEKRKPSFGN